MQNLFERLTHQMTQSIESGVSLALHNQNSEVTPLHVLWGLLSNSGSILTQVLTKMGVDKAALELDVKSEADKLTKSSGVTKETIKLSRELIESLQKAEGLMTKQGDSYLAVDVWLLANLDAKPFKNILGKYTDLLEVKKTLEALRGGKKIDKQSADETLEALSKYGIDLTQKAIDHELDPVIGRMKRSTA